MNYKKVLGALTILGALATGGTALAQTTTTSTTSSPGSPNTGAGGTAAENLALLGGSALVAVAGAAYLARRKSIA